MRGVRALFFIEKESGLLPVFSKCFTHKRNTNRTHIPRHPIVQPILCRHVFSFPSPLPKGLQTGFAHHRVVCKVLQGNALPNPRHSRPQRCVVAPSNRRSVLTRPPGPRMRRAHATSKGQHRDAILCRAPILSRLWHRFSAPALYLRKAARWNREDLCREHQVDAPFLDLKRLSSRRRRRPA